MPVETDPNLLVGMESSDDAGVYRLSDELALIQTVDFFTPIVNDPYDFGRIAAANSLSDVYAMGGRPLTALNIVCFPIRNLDKSILRDILRGGRDKVKESGAVLVGGHSVEDLELKYGLSVTGVVAPNRVLTNRGARRWDRLVLTKPLGTGILATAVKAGLASAATEQIAIECMARLNNTAAEVMAAYPVHACTDITGFGLLGHCLELAIGSGVQIRIDSARVPLLPDVLEHAGLGLVPAGSYANRNFCSDRMRGAASIDPLLLDLLADAQTSGGLLISVAGSEADDLVAALRSRGVDEAAVIGEVIGAGDGLLDLS